MTGGPVSYMHLSPCVDILKCSACLGVEFETTSLLVGILWTLRQGNPNKTDIHCYDLPERTATCPESNDFNTRPPNTLTTMTPKWWDGRLSMWQQCAEGKKQSLENTIDDEIYCKPRMTSKPPLPEPCLTAPPESPKEVKWSPLFFRGLY